MSRWWKGVCVWTCPEMLARLNIALHRDIGYVCASLIVAYCMSGIALNHINDWNPDFVIMKQTVTLPRPYAREEITASVVEQFGRLVNEDRHKVFDFPTKDQVKIYYDNASLHLHLSRQEGVYEKISRRPLFYQVNALHLNRLQGWRWAADIFALILILLSMTGLFVLRGRYGFSRRGKWLVTLGLLPPLLGWVFFELK